MLLWSLALVSWNSWRCFGFWEFIWNYSKVVDRFYGSVVGVYGCSWGKYLFIS
jgi:hypothetical protein